MFARPGGRRSCRDGAPFWILVQVQAGPTATTRDAMNRILGIIIATGWLVGGVAEPASATTCSSFVANCKRIVVGRCRATNCTAWQRDYASVDCDRFAQQCITLGNW